MVDMTAFDRVKKLCDEQKISIVELEERLKFGRNSLYGWKKKTPNGANLIKVAEYFNVSTDYLLGRTDSRELENNHNKISDEDFRKIERFARNLTPKDRKKALKILEATFDDAFNGDEEDEEDDL